MLTLHNNRLSYSMNDRVSNFSRKKNNSLKYRFKGVSHQGMRNAACRALSPYLWRKLGQDNRNTGDFSIDFDKRTCPLTLVFNGKEPVKLIKRVKVAHSFLQSVSSLFHFIILSLPM